MARGIQTKLVVVYLLLILFSLQLIGAYFVRSLNSSLMRNETQTVQAQAQLLATMAAQRIGQAAQNEQTVSPILTSLPQLVGGAAYILNKQGVVIDTSVGRALIGQKRVDSVVTETTVSHKSAVAIRVDPLTNQHLLEVAVPIDEQGKFQGVVEYVVPVQNIYITIRQVTTIFYTASLVALILTVVLSLILSRTITRPVTEVTRQARHMAEGDYTQRVIVRSDDEFGKLATAINDLAEQWAQAVAVNAHEQERLQAIIQYMGDGVVVFDAALRPMLFNETAARLLRNQEGYRGDLADILGLAQEDRTDVPAGGHIKSVGDALLHVHITAIRKEDELEGYVALIRDVTEQERLNQAHRDFVANVSHELRTPLTSIKSYIEVLRDNAEADEATRQQFLTVMEQETERMVRLTRDLLLLSGLDSKNEGYTESAIEVGPWLAGAVERFQLQARAQAVSLELDIGRVSVLLGDRDMLDRVLDNLLSNALKYTPADGRIVISARARRNSLEIKVADTGIGIPKEDLPHVFERFYRVDKARSRRKGGSGLGLALVRELTERHGGRIHIDSRVNVGTTVTLTFPQHEEGIS